MMLTPSDYDDVIVIVAHPWADTEAAEAMDRDRPRPL